MEVSFPSGLDSVKLKVVQSISHQRPHLCLIASWACTKRMSVRFMPRPILLVLTSEVNARVLVTLH